MAERIYIDPKGVLPRIASPLIWSSEYRPQLSPWPALVCSSPTVVFGVLSAWNFAAYGPTDLSTIFFLAIALVPLVFLVSLAVTMWQRRFVISHMSSLSDWRPLGRMIHLIELVDKNANLTRDPKVRKRIRMVKKYARTVEWEMAKRQPVMSRISGSSQADLRRIWERENAKAEKMVEHVAEAVDALNVYVLRAAADWGTAPAHLEIYGREVDALVRHQDALSEVEALEFVGEQDSPSDDSDIRDSLRLKQKRLLG